MGRASSFVHAHLSFPHSRTHCLHCRFTPSPRTIGACSALPIHALAALGRSERARAGIFLRAAAPHPALRATFSPQAGRREAVVTAVFSSPRSAAYGERMPRRGRRGAAPSTDVANALLTAREPRSSRMRSCRNHNDKRHPGQRAAMPRTSAHRARIVRGEAEGVNPRRQECSRTHRSARRVHASCITLTPTTPAQPERHRPASPNAHPSQCLYNQQRTPTHPRRTTFQVTPPKVRGTGAARPPIKSNRAAGQAPAQGFAA